MRAHLVVPIALALLVPSCDKAKQLVANAQKAVESKGGTASPSDGPADPELQKLVDQTPEGVLFRKDLPFPSSLTVTVTDNSQISLRTAESSELGKQTNVMTGTTTESMTFRRAGSQVAMNLQQYKFVPASKEPADKGGEKKEVQPLFSEGPVGPIQYRRDAKGWTCLSSAPFNSRILWKDLATHFDEVLVENGLAPRKMWFGKHRFKIGETLKVSGDDVAMWMPDSTGTLALKLESLAAVHGHPCAVFSVTGDVSAKNRPNMNGEVQSQDASISSGKLWVSLLYPVILREELDTILSYRSGGQGGQVSRGQGTVKVLVEREWKAAK